MYTTKNIYPTKTLSNVFEELFNNFPATPQVANSFSKVPTNIFENPDGYELQLMAPGRAKEEFSIKLEDNLLTISAEAKEAEETVKAIRKEFGVAGFKRSFTLDKKINAEGITASYDNGVLRVFLPKKEEVKNSPKQITIS